MSLAVLVGAGGVWLGYPVADAAVGLLITLVILWVAWRSGREVFTRILDGVEPALLDQVERAARHVAGVREVTGVRGRWAGHRLHLELSIAVDPALSVAQGHALAKAVRHHILQDLPHVFGVTVHVDPAGESGEAFHALDAQGHDARPRHPHG